MPQGLVRDDGFTGAGAVGADGGRGVAGGAQPKGSCPRGGRPGYRARMASRRRRPTSRTPGPAREAAYRRAFEEHGATEIWLDWRCP
jgi:hypothetical protein